MKVYAIMCPISNDIVYIGKTKNLQLRAVSHCALNRSFVPNEKIYNWVESLHKINQKPVFKEIATCSSNEEALFVEKFYINVYKERYNLFNHHNNR